MRALPPGFAAHLAGGATTLALCWRIERLDGVVVAVTDHDAPIAFGGDTYEPKAAFEATAQDAKADLSVDALSGLGALSADALQEDDILAGRFDGARIDVLQVNWADPAERLHLSAGYLGEATRRDGALEVEVRGLKAALDRPEGRIYQPTCDARLGDTRCGVETSGAPNRAEGAVSAVRNLREIAVSGLDGFGKDWFAFGELTWATGARAGLTDRIVSHFVEPAAPVLILSERPHPPIAAGDAFEAVAGCDKRFETCRDKFANVVNFRGFHRMPGDDFLYSYPATGQPLDGSRR
ncbi:MAG: DUF2163 domain-containing protein [Pseudomonadota bacterium]